MMRMYPSVKVARQSFKNVEVTVVPNQSMSLREIVARFLRKESLPLSHEGFYEERFGDLEKMKNEDITEKVQRVEVLKKKVKEGEKAEKERLKKEGEEKAAKEEAAFKDKVQKLTAEQKPPGPANSPPV